MWSSGSDVLNFSTGGVERLELNWSGSTMFTSFSVDDTTDSSSGTTGSIHTDGGLGVAKNIYSTGDTFTLTQGKTGGLVQGKVANTATSGISNAEFAVEVDPSSTGDPALKVGIIGTVGWQLAIDNSQSDRFSIGNGTVGTAYDAIRITNASPPVVSFNTTQGADFDYVCDKCGKHETLEFTCCGTVEWHDEHRFVYINQRNRNDNSSANENGTRTNR
jgi:hypothetical protein